jgi:hypothetical protein
MGRFVYDYFLLFCETLLAVVNDAFSLLERVVLFCVVLFCVMMDITTVCCFWPETIVYILASI